MLVDYYEITTEKYQSDFSSYDDLKYDSSRFTNNNSSYHDFEKYYQNHYLRCTIDSIEFKDHFDPNDNWGHWVYGYYGYLDTLDLHIIDVSSYEWESYILVDDKTCMITDTLSTPPLFSVDGNLIVHFDTCFPNYLDYYTRKSNGYEHSYTGEIKEKSSLYYHLGLDMIKEHYWVDKYTFRYKTLVEYQGDLINEYYELKFSFPNE